MSHWCNQNSRKFGDKKIIAKQLAFQTNSYLNCLFDLFGSGSSRLGFRFLNTDRAQLMAKHRQHLIDFSQIQAGFALLNFADNRKCNPCSFGKLFLSEVDFLSMLFYEIG